ncbi:MAG: N5-glutamine methyltransferase family protein [Actinoallomurus sp.]
MKLGALIEDAIQDLVDTGAVINPRKDAETLAAHLLGAEEAARLTDQELDDQRAKEYRALVDQRVAGVPLGHLTGFAVLGDVEVAVGPGVFVPRVQTETTLAAGLGAVEDVADPLVVDFCTGSGAVALAAAHHRPDATVHAVDFDPVALGFARQNSARRAELGDTPIVVHDADVTDPAVLAELDGKVDLVLALPPFMPDESEVPIEFSEHQPRAAVFSGADGLDVIRAIVTATARLLRPGGTFVVEHGHVHVETVPELLRQDGRFENVTAHVDQYEWPLYTVATRRD